MNFSHSRAGAAATYEAAAPTLAPQGTGHGEFVLATPSPGRIDERARLRRITLQLSGAALVATLIVAVAGSLVSRHIAEQQAVHDVAQTTDLIADTAVQPALTDSMATSSVATRAGLDRLVREHILSDQVVRVKLWNATGSVLYSDEPRLVDQRFTLEDTAVKALTTPQTVADVSDLTRPENQYERGQGKLLEVYRPVWTPAGTPLLFEAYFRYQIVSDRSAQLWRGFSGVMLSTLAALVLLLIPLAWLVHAKSRAARTRHDELQRRALEASEDERRRIAATLHDGVVQDLAAIAFATAGQARQASARGEGVDAGQLQSVAASVRDSIADLRNLMTDIYPASLHTSGLAAALGDLATSNTGAPRILLDLNDDAIARLTTEQQDAAYRVAQEALRNAFRHADATTVVLRVTAVQGSRTVLEIDDDGFGFDVAAAATAVPEGHFGLSLMADTARAVGAGLIVRTSADGTTIRMEFS